MGRGCGNGGPITTALVLTKTEPFLVKTIPLDSGHRISRSTAPGFETLACCKRSLTRQILTSSPKLPVATNCPFPLNAADLISSAMVELCPTVVNRLRILSVGSHQQIIGSLGFRVAVQLSEERSLEFCRAGPGCLGTWLILFLVRLRWWFLLLLFLRPVFYYLVSSRRCTYDRATAVMVERTGSLKREARFRSRSFRGFVSTTRMWNRRDPDPIKVTSTTFSTTIISGLCLSAYRRTQDMVTRLRPLFA